MKIPWPNKTWRKIVGGPLGRLLLGSEFRSQNFDFAKFQEVIPRKPRYGAFFLGTWPQNSSNVLSHRPSPNLAQNFGQIPSRALGLTTFSELHFEVVAPRFEEMQGRQTGRQQTIAFRHRRRSPTELGNRGECPTYRPLPVLSLSLSIWSGSALRDVAVSKTAYRCQVHTLRLRSCVYARRGCRSPPPHLA